MCIDTGVSMECHARYQVQEAAVTFEVGTFPVALRIVFEDICISVVFIALSFHIQSVACHTFAVQRTRTGHSAHS